MVGFIANPERSGGVVMTMVVSATGEALLLALLIEEPSRVDGLSAVMVMRLARLAGYGFRHRDDGVHLVHLAHHEYDDNFQRPPWLVKGLETHTSEIARLVSDPAVSVCYLNRAPNPRQMGVPPSGEPLDLPDPPMIG